MKVSFKYGSSKISKKGLIPKNAIGHWGKK